MKKQNLQLAVLLGLIILVACVANGQPANPSMNNEPNIVYRVQILALKNPIKFESLKVNGVDGEVYTRVGNGFTTYYMGELRDLKSAADLKEQLVKNGFQDACIVALKNDTRITIKESLKLLGEDK